MKIELCGPAGRVVVAAAGLMAVVAGSALAHDMVEVGLDASKKRLAAHFDITFPIALPESSIPTVPGWAGAELGFEALLFDDAIEEVYKLPDNCDIKVRIMSYTPGVFLWNDHTTAQLQVGETFNPGTPYFHTHPIWQITQPGFGQNFVVVMQLEDALGNYQTSEQFTVTFTPVPAPGAAGVLAMAGLMGRRRRR